MTQDSKDFFIILDWESWDKALTCGLLVMEINTLLGGLRKGSNGSPVSHWPSSSSEIINKDRKSWINEGNTHLEFNFSLMAALCKIIAACRNRKSL